MKFWIGAVLGSLMLAASVSGSHAEGRPTEVARKYFAAMDAGKLDDAEALFAEESSVFETGGTEGTWAHYREHHLGPEIDAIDSFETRLGDPEEGRSADGSMAFVAWPLEYRIVLKDERVINSKGTVTFVLVKRDTSYRIRHVHWSSRRMKAEGH